MMEDDFTFPTTVSAATTAGRRDADVLANLGNKLPPTPDVAAPAGAAARLWPFAAPPTIGAAATVLKDAASAAPAPIRRGLLAEEERAAAADDEERMDLLRENPTVTPSPQASRSGGGYVEPPREHRAVDAAEPQTKDERAAAVANHEKMDQLWQSFNEELLLRRARSKAAVAAAPLRLDPDWYLCDDSSPSDAETVETSASFPARPRYGGCAPTMLRASSRAGGAGQFCASPRRRRRISRGGWALLLRLFRRLFAVDKTASHHHHVGIHVP